MKYLTLLVALALVGCEVNSAAPAPKAALAHSPTATEVFNLRTKCGKLGQELAKLRNVDARNVLSNYSIEGNRCYVMIDEVTVPSSRQQRLHGLGFHQSRTLYDSQTGEMLARTERSTDKDGHMQQQGDVPGSPDDIMADCYTSPDVNEGDCRWSKANSYISSKMKREE